MIVLLTGLFAKILSGIQVWLMNEMRSGCLGRQLGLAFLVQVGPVELVAPSNWANSIAKSLNTSIF